jgi:hypothetical protein
MYSGKIAVPPGGGGIGECNNNVIQGDIEMHHNTGCFRS